MPRAQAAHRNLAHTAYVCAGTTHTSHAAKGKADLPARPRQQLGWEKKPPGGLAGPSPKLPHTCMLQLQLAPVGLCLSASGRVGFGAILQISTCHAPRLSRQARRECGVWIPTNGVYPLRPRAARLCKFAALRRRPYWTRPGGNSEIPSPIFNCQLNPSGVFFLFQAKKIVRWYADKPLGQRKALIDKDLAGSSGSRLTNSRL